jgi:NAD(P)-dependent dehydrogenase (short-subunit alcohol dehydrogenase family)
MDFTGKTVLITGAHGNLGRALAAAFDKLGAGLALIDRHAPPSHDPRKLMIAADLLDPVQTEGAVAQAIAHFGALDVACNLAGGFSMGPAVHESSDADWDHLFALNVRTVLNVTRAVAPHFISRGGGKLINVGANSASRGLAQMGPYCASKSAVARITEASSAELRDHHINVNAVLPSILDTPENRAAMPDADFTRWVAPEALADVMVFLASDAARAIHGALIPVLNRA